MPLDLSLVFGLLFQAAHGRFDGLQPLLTSLQLRGQFVPAATAQHRVLLGVDLLGLLEQGCHLGPQSLDLLLHVAIAHGLVPRRVGTELRAVEGQVAQLDHPQFARDTEHLDEQVLEPCLVDLAEVANGAEVGRWSPTMARKARLHSPAAAIRRLEKTPTQ